MKEFIQYCESILIQSNRKLIGYFCTYTPLEIIHAAGLTPHRIIGLDKPVQGADGYMHANICPYVRSCLDCALEGKISPLEGVVFVNSCDAMRRLYNVWQKYTPSNFHHLIDLPKRQGNLDELYLKLEFEKFRESIEKHFSLLIPQEVLGKSIALYREMRSLLKRLYTLRQEKSEIIKASDILKIMNYSTRIPPELFNISLSSLLERIEGTQDRPVSKPKILLVGSIIHHPSIIKIIESCGAAVVNDDLCSGSRIFEIDTEIEGEPVEVLAKAYLHKAPCGRMIITENNIKRIGYLINMYQIEGVIHYTLKFCDNVLYNIPRTKMFLNEKGIKSLFIEGDYTSSSIGQVRTRVEAFIEMLG